MERAWSVEDLVGGLWRMGERTSSEQVRFFFFSFFFPCLGGQPSGLGGGGRESPRVPAVLGSPDSFPPPRPRPESRR